MNSFLAGLFQPPPEFRLVSSIFLKALALIYLAAFASLAIQITGLAGSNGILSFQVFLENARKTG